VKTYEYICAKEETENHRKPWQTKVGGTTTQDRQRGCTAFAARAFADRELPGWDEIEIRADDGEEVLWKFLRADGVGKALPDRISDKPEPRAAFVEPVPADFHKEARDAKRLAGMTQEQRDRDDEEKIYEYARQMRPRDPIPRGSLAGNMTRRGAT
jgi:hypothetical protein